ncbi:hypothetical protein WG902_14655 [Ramlibacter sp. PS3R-8]|uniref:hypothetical protein n=1 Tax=Ramlibacter sp. PS3R-8 TaxID=3133437 RepID=UPI0030AAC879
MKKKMLAGAMKGCDRCSALMYADEVFCPTCGAGVQEAQTAGGTVRIPVRRHGVIPPVPSRALALERTESHALRGAVVGLLVSVAAAGAAAAAIYRLW